MDLLRPSYQQMRDCRPTDLLAFIELLYMTDIEKDQNLNTKKLWAIDGTAPEYFPATMSRR